VKARVAGAQIELKLPEVAVLGASGSTSASRLRVRSSLELNAVAIENPGHRPLVVISIDALYVGSTLEAAARQLSETYSCEVLFGASHTHRAPMLDSRKPRLGSQSSEFVREVRETLSRLIPHLLAKLGRAAPSSLEARSVITDLGINRRKWRALAVENRRVVRRRVVMAPNREGVKDDIITVLVARSASGLEGILWNYACHPVGEADLCVSAHFPGAVREAIRQQFGQPGLPVVFLQGFSGNVRPKLGLWPSKLDGRTVFRAVVGGFYPISRRALNKWMAKLSCETMEAVDAATPISPGPIVIRRETLDLGIRRAASSEAVPVQVVGIEVGPDMAIVAISAEVVAEYAADVRSRRPYVMPVGCVGDSFGYLPTDKIALEGGYEGGDFCASFNLEPLPCPVEPSVRAAIDRVLPRYIAT